MSASKKSFCSKDIADLKNQELYFLKYIWDLCRNIANKEKFHYIPNSEKIN